MLLLRYVINTVVIYCDWKIHWFSGAHRCDLCQVLGVTMKGKVISFAYIFKSLIFSLKKVSQNILLALQVRKVTLCIFQIPHTVENMVITGNSSLHSRTGMNKTAECWELKVTAHTAGCPGCNVFLFVCNAF